MRFTYANGLERGADGLIYVPSSFLGKIWVFKPDGAADTLEKVAEITSHAMPVDNLSRDRDGALWGAGFPDILGFVGAATDALRKDSRTTVWRLRKAEEGSGSVGEDVKGQGGYVMEKVIEDREMKVLGGATVAVHDAETGRIFTGGESFVFRFVFLVFTELEQAAAWKR